MKTRSLATGIGLSLVCTLVWIPSAANASLLLGSSVFGEKYDWSSPGVATTILGNQFDPVYGFVLPGYGNSTGPTTTIVDPGIEFDVSASPTNFATLDFTDSTLTLTKVIPSLSVIGGNEFVFTDTAFSGLTVTKTQDSFDNGGVTAQLVGDTLTLTLAPTCILGPGCSWTSLTETAQFSFSGSSTPQSVPEPATLSLLGAGLLGMFMRRRRNKAA